MTSTIFRSRLAEGETGDLEEAVVVVAGLVEGEEGYLKEAVGVVAVVFEEVVTLAVWERDITGADAAFFEEGCSGTDPAAREAGATVGAIKKGGGEQEEAAGEMGWRGGGRSAVEGAEDEN